MNFIAITPSTASLLQVVWEAGAWRVGWGNFLLEVSEPRVWASRGSENLSQPPTWFGKGDRDCLKQPFPANASWLPPCYLSGLWGMATDALPLTTDVVPEASRSNWSHWPILNTHFYKKYNPSVSKADFKEHTQNQVPTSFPNIYYQWLSIIWIFKFFFPIHRSYYRQNISFDALLSLSMASWMSRAS